LKLSRFLSIPREPSVAGMIVVSGLAGLLVSGLNLGLELLIPLTAILLHFFTFDQAFNSLRAKDYNALLVIVLLNTVPYIAGSLLHGLVQVGAVVAVGLAVIALHIGIARIYGMNNPYTYISGAAIPVLPALAAPSLAASLSPPVVVLWALLTIYSMTTAAYIETRLRFRNYDKKKPLLIWLPALLGAAYCPYTAVAMIEPTVKLAVNIKSNKKVSSSREIKIMGAKELTRLFIFTALLVAILSLCRKLL